MVFVLQAINLAHVHIAVNVCLDTLEVGVKVKQTNAARIHVNMENVSI
jgi:hypothetical protein